MDFVELASGLEFPEGSIAMGDGSILLTEIARGTLTRVTPDGRVEVVAETGGGPERGRRGTGWACLDHEQRRLRVGPLGRPAAARRTGARLRHGLDPARRSRERHGRDRLHRVRRGAAQGPERHRLRRGRRLLVLGSGQEPRVRPRSGRALLRDDRRQPHLARRLPHPGRGQRRRPGPGRHARLRRRDADRAVVRLGDRRARRAGRGPRRRRLQTPSSPTPAATRCSTRSRWRSRATSAWRPSVRAESR